ncbi:monocarboxylate transporter 5-like isoform X2 [Haemaphysalis longicornis]
MKTTSPQCSKRTMSRPQDRCWGIPFVAMCACFLLCMPMSSTGYLYVLFMQKYEINRETASWPESIITFSQNFGGFMVSLLMTRISICSVVVVSASVSCVGLVCAAFAPNIAWMSATLGAVYGMGTGGSIVSFSVLTMLYFDKYRATATAFKYVGWAASGVAGPVILSALDTNYGLGGALLLSSSIALNAMPLLMLIRSPRPIRCKCSQWKQRKTKTRRYEEGPQKSDGQGRIPETPSSSPKKSLPSSRACEFPREQQSVFRGSLTVVNAISAEYDARVVSASKPCYLCINGSCTDCLTAAGTARCDKEFSRNNRFLTMHGQCGQDVFTGKPTLKAILSRQLRLFRDPAFYILLVGYALCDYAVSMHTTTTVDYGRDKGATLEDATLVITYSALGQFLGRTLLPFACDHVHNGRCKFAVACFAAAAVFCAVLSVVKSYPAFVALNVALGLSEGFVTCIRSVLVNDFLGVDRLPVFFGFQSITLIPLSLSGPTIIGYFRDSLGSYDNFYRLLAAVNLENIVTGKRRSRRLHMPPCCPP